MVTLADATQLDTLIARLTEAIDQRMRAAAEEPWALVGVRSRGDVLAGRIADRLGRERLADRVGALDITLYRDDLSEVGPQAKGRTTRIPFAIDGLNLVLIDDVVMTGRSVRAALTSLMDLGRPRRVWLAALVDRPERELPIAVDFVGWDLGADAAGAPRPGEQVQVLLTPWDERDAIESRPGEADA